MKKKTVLQNNLPKSNIQEVTELGFKPGSGSEVFATTVLGDLLSESEEQVPALDSPEGTHP